MMTLMMSAAIFAKAERQVVNFSVDLHCQGCVDKVMHNIAYEKGVKDIQCSLKDKTVTVTFDPAKTDVQKLQDAFAKIKKPATVIPATDSQSGATPQK